MNIRNRYRSHSDVSMRHCSTFVGVRSPSGIVVPYYVESTSEYVLNLRKASLSTTGLERLNKNIDDPDLIIDRPECGMYNVLNSANEILAQYLSVQPARQTKRSFSLSNTQYLVMESTVRPLGSYRRDGFDDNLFGMLDTFFNDKYPTFQGALTSIKNGQGFVLSIAFSREFALGIAANGNGIILLYKGALVGFLDGEDILVLNNGFEYLHESLEEATQC
ncbi:hypothetical protein [Pseudoalteromonas phage vB_PtuP_Slicky01]|nr:hypothetical protein [Pseudoalteromonas phage vB_PtuP_Slicky01]